MRTDLAIKRAGELSPPLKAAIEGLFGRPLSDDEEVRVMVLRAHRAPSGPAGEAAANQLKAVLDSMAKKAKDVPTEEFEAAIEEAMKEVRPRPQ